MSSISRGAAVPGTHSLKNYRCPISGTSATEEGVEGEWIDCPMMNQPIYIGACFDLKGIAISQDFENHPFVDEFYTLSRKLNVDIEVLRKTCLNHQEEMLTDILTSSDNDNCKSIEHLIDQVNKAKDNLEK